MDGRNLSSTSRTIVTKVAMMSTNAGMRTLSGMTFRKRETNTLEQISTNVTAAPMPIPFIASVVSASVGQVPSTSLKVGFEVITPSTAIFL